MVGRIELPQPRLDESALAARRINELVEQIETTDPWVKATFGIEGVGEGIVLYPELEDSLLLDRTRLSELMFKAKGEKHQVVRQKKPAQLEPEVARGLEELSVLVLGEARLEQGLTEACGGKLDTTLLGAFLKWVAKDVQKECTAELEAAGVTWSQANKAISARARAWFLAKARVSLQA